MEHLVLVSVQVGCDFLVLAGDFVVAKGWKQSMVLFSKIGKRKDIKVRDD